MKSAISKVALSAVCLVCSAPVFASITWFTTLQQAEQNCPATTKLIYTSVAANDGIIQGLNPQRRLFISYRDTPPVGETMQRPANLAPESSGAVGNVSFRYDTFGYGYIQNGNIVCLYSYPGYQTQVGLVETTDPDKSMTAFG